jgi:hypothetical protein
MHTSMVGLDIFKIVSQFPRQDREVIKILAIECLCQPCRFQPKLIMEKSGYINQKRMINNF